MKITCLNNDLINHNIFKQPKGGINNNAALLHLQTKDTFTFGQALLKTTPARQTCGRVSDLNFVEYNEDDIQKLEHLAKEWDLDYLSNITKTFENEDGIHKIFPLVDAKERIVGLENKNGKIIAIAQIIEIEDIIEDKFENFIGIIDIQADPKEMYKSKEKHYRGLGETLAAEIVKIAKTQNRECVNLISANNEFWDSSGFFKDPNPCPSFARTLAEDDFDNYINFVKNKLKIFKDF